MIKTHSISADFSLARQIEKLQARHVGPNKSGKMEKLNIREATQAIAMSLEKKIDIDKACQTILVNRVNSRGKSLEAKIATEVNRFQAKIAKLQGGIEVSVQGSQVSVKYPKKLLPTVLRIG